MACKYCGKPVVLTPSAAYRAKQDRERGTPREGGAAYYTRLFPNHAACVVANRSQQARDVFAKAQNKGQENA